MGKMFFNILATFAEFEADLIRMRTREGMAVARAKGKLRGKQPKLSEKQQRELSPHARHRRLFHQRLGRGLRCFQTDRLPNDQPRRRFLMTIPYGAIYRQKIVPFSVESHNLEVFEGVRRCLA